LTYSRSDIKFQCIHRWYPTLHIRVHSRSVPQHQFGVSFTPTAERR